MIYNSFLASSKDGKKVFKTSESLLSVVSINTITFNVDPNAGYEIKASFNKSDKYVDVDTDLLLNLTSLMEESVDIDLMFIFADSEEITSIEIDYTSAYEFMMGIVDDSILDKMQVLSLEDDTTEEVKERPVEMMQAPQMFRSSDVSWLAAADGKISFWKGSKAKYDAISTKDTTRLYYVTDTSQVYLGNLIMSNNVEVSWGAVNGTQSNKISIGGVEKDFSLSTHSHDIYVPTSRTINGYSLTGNILLTAEDVGALSSTGTIDNSKYLTSAFNSITASPTAGKLGFGLVQSTASGNKGTAGEGGFPVNNNANALITIGTSGSNYHSQLGFSSDGNLYHRHVGNKTLDTTTSWGKIWDSKNFNPATKANTDQTMYIGTTSVAINRSSAAITLAGVNISGNAGTASSVDWANIANKPTSFDPATHNHTTLTGVTNIGFAAHTNDAAYIRTTISSVSTYMDFCLSDDINQEKWRWMFTPSGQSEFVAMELSPVTNTTANLKVSGEVSGTILKATATTGTSPLNISSTTLVTNLNAQYLNGLTSGSFMRTDTNTSTSGTLSVNNTSESTSSSTGALKVSGGVGVAKNVNVGGELSVASNITTNGTYNFGGSAQLVFNTTNKSIQFIFK